MGSTGFQAATLEGFYVLSAGTPELLTGVEMYMDGPTNPKVLILGATVPKRVQYAGFYGAAYTSTGEPTNPIEVAVWQHPIGFDHEYTNLTPLSVFADRLIWRLPWGLTIHLNAHW